MKYISEDHTFAICAFGESKYLEECIESVRGQIYPTNVIICTSTPSDYIESIARKYDIKLHINEKHKFNSDIANDWNYAIACANTPLITIAHQDDIYKKNYSKDVISAINRSQKPLIAFTDYAELRNGREVSNIRNLNIKRIMLFPLRFKVMWRSRFVRRRILSFGSAICCPSVTYVKPNLPEELFSTGYKVSLDWQAWERFSKLDGDFVFLNDILMVHRIHEESETSRNIVDSNRTAEDFDMLCKFWPRGIAKMIEHWYKKSEKQNKLV